MTAAEECGRAGGDARAGVAAPVRVLRLISRLNIGGPSIQVISLTRLLEPLGYSTTLLRGTEGVDEGSMDYLAEEYGVRPVLVPSLGRELGSHDFGALLAVRREIRRIKPDILHTHAAKGGTIGRLASLLSGRRRPRVTVHTFHGHVFRGVFDSRVRVAFFIWVERLLARRTTRLVAVSEEVRDDLVRLRIAPPERIETVRLGFDLSRFDSDAHERERLRRETRRRLGLPDGVRVVTLIARLVRMKRVDRFLEMAAHLTDLEDVRFLIVGDGELSRALQASPGARRLADRVTWAGFQREIPGVCFASDIVVLTSDNEGTPVCLIEAQAAGVPVVSTDVGGVATVVRDEETGLLVGSKSPTTIAAAVRRLLEDPCLRRGLAAGGRAHSLSSFSQARMVADIDRLYSRLLTELKR